MKTIVFAEYFTARMVNLGLFFIFIFLSLSLGTYSPLDPSLNNLFQEVHVVQNWFGLIGSHLADILYQIFGWGAWFFPVMVLFYIVKRFKAFEFSAYQWLWLSLIPCLISLTLDLLTDLNGFENHVRQGGVIGLASASFLTQYLNTIGSVIVLFFVWLMSLAVILESIMDHKIQALISVMRFSFLRKEKKSKINTNVKNTELKKNKKPHAIRLRTQSKKQITTQQIAGKKNVQEAPSMILRKGKTESGEKTDWTFPSIKNLEKPIALNRSDLDKEEKILAQKLVDKLSQFNIESHIKKIESGPLVTRFELSIDQSVKVSRITELSDDLSLALSAESIRIIAPIPGTNVVGVEASRVHKETVYLQDCLKNVKEGFKIPLLLGKNVSGKVFQVDLQKIPHLLIAGSTGSGKSVFVVSLVTQWLFLKSPKDLRLILIDPKQVDLSLFEGVPHLLTPVVKQTKKAVKVLKWAVYEMEKRYRSMAEFGARDLDSYNEKVALLNKEEIENHKKIQEAEGFPGASKYYYEKLPRLVIVIEEFADLMTVDKQQVETSVVRLAQMARASGMHLILALQSPRKDVVTGLIKTNIPGRISFKVASKTDSRIILDEGGAERLLARGDLLFQSPQFPQTLRAHGPWISDKDLGSIIDFWREQGPPEYFESIQNYLAGNQNPGQVTGGAHDSSDDDDMYEEIYQFVQDQKTVSASYLQRKFRLGYPRAARIMELLETKGVVGPPEGSKPRKVLHTRR